MRVNVSVALRPIGLDDAAQVRHLHSLAFRAFAGPWLVEDQLDALIEHVRSPAYSDYLLGYGCVGAWIDNYLCGTAGWGPSSSVGASAKLVGICVDPLFSGTGVGRQVVEAAEFHARRAGFDVLSVRTLGNAVPFFECLGYKSTSQGVWTLPSGVSIPVSHMRKDHVVAMQRPIEVAEIPVTDDRLRQLTRLH